MSTTRVYEASSSRRRVPALEAAERKGREARAAGKTEADCPYEDHRKPDGRLTWSRAYRNAWITGFRWSKERP